MIDGELREKYQTLIGIIAARKRIAVAFSGGVDSSFLCHCAVEAVGRDCAIAVTVVSPMLPASELECARTVAAQTGITHILVEETTIDEEVAANPKERCYYCKKIEFASILRVAAEHGIQTVLDGSNLDDENDYRPGLRALAELAIFSPLREAHFTKAEIRELSCAYHLPTWNKPAFACLASRFPYGERLDTGKLSRVEQSEAYLSSLGFRQFRVRSHGNIARIEVAAGERQKLFDIALLDTISRTLKSYGFLFVAMELEGYVTGSLNAEL